MRWPSSPDRPRGPWGVAVGCHSPGDWYVLSSAGWTMIAYIVVRDIAVAVLCGMGFGAVSALTLPTPAAQTPQRSASDHNGREFPRDL